MTAPSLDDLRGLQQHLAGADLCPACWAVAVSRARLAGGRPEDFYAHVVAEVERDG